MVSDLVAGINVGDIWATKPVKFNDSIQYLKRNFEAYDPRLPHNINEKIEDRELKGKPAAAQMLAEIVRSPQLYSGRSVIFPAHIDTWNMANRIVGSDAASWVVQLVSTADADGARIYLRITEPTHVDWKEGDVVLVTGVVLAEGNFRLATGGMCPGAYVIGQTIDLHTQ